MNKEIKGRIFSIIYLIIFLSFSTWFIFGPREKLVYATMNINNSKVTNKDIVISSNNTLNYNKEAYNFSVTNKNNKKYNYEILVVNDYKKSILKDCKVLSNNYLKYHIKDKDDYGVSRNVNTNGVIYRSSIEPYETKNFTIKLWLDKKKDSSDCYFPILKTNIK